MRRKDTSSGCSSNIRCALSGALFPPLSHLQYWIAPSWCEENILWLFFFPSSILQGNYRVYINTQRKTMLSDLSLVFYNKLFYLTSFEHLSKSSHQKLIERLIIMFSKPLPVPAGHRAGLANCYAHFAQVGALCLPLSPFFPAFLPSPISNHVINT